jgi:hypothetical protein
MAGCGLKRFGGVNRWSPPGRLARKRAPKPPKRTQAPVCPYCYVRHLGMRCLSALSSPQQRADDFGHRR